MRLSLQLAVGLMVILPVILVFTLESTVRFYRFRYAPLRLKLLYALYLLNDNAVQAIYVITQRIERCGLRSFDQLFDLYASASGKCKAEIEKLFGFQMPWLQLRSFKFAPDYHLQWNRGLVAKPDQQLRTLSIMSNGKRAIGTEPDCGKKSGRLKRVAVTGGSFAFGYGATSDATTIAGRLQSHLNRSDSRDLCWLVENRAIEGAGSFQELIDVLQNITESNKPDYLVSVSGWNDVDHQFQTSLPNSSIYTQGYTDHLQYYSHTAKERVLSFLNQHFLCLSVIRRFIVGYFNWPGGNKSHDDSYEADKLSTRNEMDNPNIYPLY